MAYAPLSHPALPQLALFARGDLSVWRRWRVERHLRVCEECAQLAGDFVAMQDEVSRAAELPSSLSGSAWRSLAAEMSANIHLGLAAGDCVSVKPGFAARPRLAFALAGLAMLVILVGVESSVPIKAPVPQAVVSQAVISPTLEDTGLRTLEASSNGIAVHSAGRMLSVSAPPGFDVIQTVNTRGDMHARYTDDTGVTVNAVYADAE